MLWWVRHLQVVVCPHNATDVMTHTLNLDKTESHFFFPSTFFLSTDHWKCGQFKSQRGLGIRIPIVILSDWTYFFVLKHFFYEYFVVIPASNFIKHDRDIRQKCKKKKKTQKIQQYWEKKRIFCVFKYWLNCELTSFEALLSIKKTIQRHRGARSLFTSFRTNTIFVKFG